jgi:uncharacterized membrane protein
LLLLVGVVAVLAFPSVAFPSPGTNDSIGLADAELPLLLVVLGGAVVVYVVFRGEGGAVVRIAVGSFLLGVAVALVIGLFAFGNTSNDRFGALLLFPPVIGLVGLVGIVVAVAAHHRQRMELIRGAFYGFALAVFFGAVLLARGARAWLLAPYGFDLFLLMLLLGAILIMAGVGPSVRSRPPDG